MERARCIVLAEEEGTEEMVICRYQSCEKVCQRILFFCRKRGGAALVSQTNRQKWLVMTADCTVSQMLAFSVTLAYLLGQKGRTLYLNLSECSGMGELFLMDPGTDLSDMILELRQDEGVLLEAFTRRLEQVDCILPPDNPMVLHEIREQDVEKILRKVQETDLYEYVVLALGSSCCGCDLFFQRGVPSAAPDPGGGNVSGEPAGLAAADPYLPSGTFGIGQPDLAASGICGEWGDSSAV